MKKIIIWVMFFTQILYMQELSASYDAGDDQKNNWHKKMLEYIHAQDQPSQENIEYFQALIGRAKFMVFFHQYAQPLLQESIDCNKFAYIQVLLNNGAHPNARSHFDIRTRNY